MGIFNEKNKNPFKVEDIGRIISGFWVKRHTAVLFSYFLIVIAIGCYVWYENLYTQAWSQEKRDAYIAENDKGIYLKEKELQMLIEDIHYRQKQYLENEKTAAADIFEKYK